MHSFIGLGHVRGVWLERGGHAGIGDFLWLAHGICLVYFDQGIKRRCAIDGEHHQCANLVEFADFAFADFHHCVMGCDNLSQCV